MFEEKINHICKAFTLGCLLLTSQQASADMAGYTVLDSEGRVYAKGYVYGNPYPSQGRIFSAQDRAIEEAQQIINQKLRGKGTFSAVPNQYDGDIRVP